MPKYEIKKPYKLEKHLELSVQGADKLARGWEFTWDKSNSLWINNDESYPMEYDSEKKILYSNVPRMGISNAINCSAESM